MNDLEIIENEMPDKQVICVVGRRTGMSVNVGTIGHIDHGKKILGTLVINALNYDASIPECFVNVDKNEPYYRRFEKKKK